MDIFARKDFRTSTGIYYIDGKRMQPYEAVEYMVTHVGFTRQEAIEYLNCLTSR